MVDTTLQLEKRYDEIFSSVGMSIVKSIRNDNNAPNKLLLMSIEELQKDIEKKSIVANNVDLDIMLETLNILSKLIKNLNISQIRASNYNEFISRVNTNIPSNFDRFYDEKTQDYDNYSFVNTGNFDDISDNNHIYLDDLPLLKTNKHYTNYEPQYKQHNGLYQQPTFDTIDEEVDVDGFQLYQDPDLLTLNNSSNYYQNLEDGNNNSYQDRKFLGQDVNIFFHDTELFDDINSGNMY